MCKPYQLLKSHDTGLTYRKTWVFPTAGEAGAFVKDLGLSARYVLHGEVVTVLSYEDGIDAKDKLAMDRHGSPAEGDDGTWQQKAM